jgi:hypothetical protein
VAGDVRAALDLAGVTGDTGHNQLTAKMRTRAKKGGELSGLIMEAARIRRFLG